jgi:hypothetical protein
MCNSGGNADPVLAGRLGFRSVNRADRITGDRLGEKVVWQLIKLYADRYRHSRSPSNVRQTVPRRWRRA